MEPPSPQKGLRRTPGAVASSVTTLCGCFEMLIALHRSRNDAREREEYEQTVSFLSSVPIFQMRLPRSELPRVARLLRRQEWVPGQRLVRQGDTGRAFFLIESGEALVTTAPEGGGRERVRTVLAAGDYFGGHTLTTDKRNVATIAAKGPNPLVTLSMSRTAFERSGLQKIMFFPKRPAIYEDGPCGLQVCSDDAPAIAALEEAFINAAIHRNINFRALLDARDEGLHNLARTACRRVVPAGTTLVSAGAPCREFFIVYSGSFRAECSDRVGSSGQQQSAEAAVSHSTMAERMLRKQNFIKNLSSSSVGIQKRQQNPSAYTDHDLHIDSRQHSWSGVSRVVDGGLSATQRTLTGGSQRRRQPRQVRHHTLAVAEMENDDDVHSGGSPGRAEHPPSESVEFGPGECFGELSAMYNCQWWANFHAQEDSVVYAVDSRHFKQCFCPSRQLRLKEYCELLDEVHALTALLSSERWELARNANGLIDFKPGERILHQGKVREARQWYVVCSGSGIMLQERPDGTRIELGEVRRGIHFGERSLLRHEHVCEISIDAGPEGLCCLVFDFELTRVLLERIFNHLDGLIPSIFCNIEEWCVQKTSGWGVAAKTSSRRPSRVTTMMRDREIKLRDLRRVKPLGRGAYGHVSLVEHGKTNQKYALKTISKKRVQRHNCQRHVSWERELMLMVDSPFVIRLHRTFHDSQSVYFLLECALGGTLLELLHRHSEVFLEDTPRGSSAAFYAACLTNALEHLHERNIVHRDLKPENVLLDDRGYAKLGDMGFARFILGKSNTLVGTPDYMAPEMIDFPHTHTIAVDWWALGVVTFELATGQVPFEDAGMADEMARLMAIRRSQEQHRLEFPVYFPRVVKGFVRDLLQTMPARLGATKGAAEVRNHVMFKELHFDFNALEALQLESPAEIAAREENESQKDPFVRSPKGASSLTLGPSSPAIGPSKMPKLEDSKSTVAFLQDGDIGDSTSSPTDQESGDESDASDCEREKRGERMDGLQDGVLDGWDAKF